ncbi:MAG: hypothetical protein HY985_06760 [Magnetospirillum sp.]|nr:hypothetical protein [Magnetospirillum sp.]
MTVPGETPLPVRFLPRQGRRWIAVAGLLVALLAPACPVSAQTTPRAAAHDGFARMVFDWDGPLKWSADVTDNQLVVRFEKPVAGDPKALLKPLAKYVKGVTVSPDRRMLTFPLAIAVTAKTFLTGNSTVIDLTETKGGAKPPAPAPVAAPPAVGPAKPAKTGGADGAADVMVRGGEHTGFNRLVFDWPKPVGYSVSTEGTRATLTFEQVGSINATALTASLPTDVTLVEVKPAGKGTAVVLSLPEGMRVRHFASGPKVALDLVRAAGAPPPTSGKPAPPLAPAPGTDVEPPTVKSLDPKVPPVAPPAPAEDTRRTTSLGIGFDQPTAAAAFRRAGWLWLVFDRKSEVDVKLLKRTGGDLVVHVEQLADTKGSTVVRILTKPGVNPSVRRDGLLWVFDLREQPLVPLLPLEIRKNFDFEDRGRMMLVVADAAPGAILIRDPEVGDAIQVVPVAPVGAGVKDGRDLPGLELLPSAQGVAMVAKADGVRLEPTRAGVEIGMPGGLFMSRDPTAKDRERQTAGGGQAAQATASGPLDIGRWVHGGPDKFIADHEALDARVSQVRPEERNIQRLEVARHYLATGLGAEALGVLRVAAGADPAMVDTAPYRAVHGAANFLMMRDDEAIEDLSHPSLAGDTQAAMWLAAARSRRDPDSAGRHTLDLRLVADEMKGWPARLRISVGRVAVPVVAGAGDGKGAQRIVDAMAAAPGLSRPDHGVIAYLAGVAAEASKQYEQAINKYREAEAGDSRPERAYAARNRIELQLRRNQIGPSEAARQMEKLRFAWRGEDFEYRLLKRLGELMIADKRWGEGLRILDTIVDNFADNPDVVSVRQMMDDTFAKLFVDGAADELSPVVAIGLFDEFHQLNPQGARGDEAFRKLADRLAAVDLLDRAAELLHNQVQFRLSGMEKARVGTRLALLLVSDHRPGEALETLDISELPDVAPNLAEQRRYLRVQALHDLGRSAEALALILNDNSDPAKKLRAEINWDLKNWTQAVLALEAMVDKPEPKRPLDPAMARRVLDLATAMNLAKDERGLQRLRRIWAGHMNATPLKEAFDLLTSEPERGIVDYRRIGDKIKQVESFQTFIGEWRQRIKDKGLSSIN